MYVLRQIDRLVPYRERFGLKYYIENRKYLEVILLTPNKKKKKG